MERAGSPALFFGGTELLELVFCWWVVAMVSADLELSVELARCGAIEDAGERLACFDLLTIRISGPEPGKALTLPKPKPGKRRQK